MTEDSREGSPVNKMATADRLNADKPLEVYGRLIHRLLAFRARLAIAIVALCFASVGSLAVPLLSRDVFKEAVRQQDLDGVRRTLLLVLAATGVMALGRFIAEDQIAYVSLKMVQRLRQEMVARMLRLPMRYHVKHRTGETVSRISNDAQLIQSFTYDSLFTLGGDLLQVVGSFCLLLYLSWPLTLLLVAMVPLGAAAVGLTSKWVRKRLGQAQARQAEMTSLLTEQIIAIPAIQAFDAGRHEEERYALASDAYSCDSRTAVRFAAGSRSLVNFLGMLSIVFVLVYGLGSIDLKGTGASGLKLEDFVGFAIAAVLLAEPLTRLTRTHFEIQRSLAAGQRIFELIDAERLQPIGKALPLENVRGGIRFEKVSFHYRPTEPILREVSLTIQPRETVAIVGASGSGKSTLASLVLRFQDPISGRVFLDDHPVSEISLRSLREGIGWMGQDPLLVSGTIADNIRYGRPGATDEEIIAAASMVAADRFIRELPKGYESVVGERGVDLSGGQRARIAMARAVIRAPRIAIFDESTASLDTETESQLWASLRPWMNDRTTVIIAHRLLTILEIPRIIVIEQGRIVGDGNAHSLDETCPAFRRLFAEQMNLMAKAA